MYGACLKRYVLPSAPHHFGTARTSKIAVVSANPRQELNFRARRDKRRKAIVPKIDPGYNARPKLPTLQILYFDVLGATKLRST